MQISGKCHCGNISYSLHWPSDGSDIRARTCSCDFCTKHGGNWTSHRDAELVAEISDATRVSKYRFGTQTAEFYVCATCGVVPFASCTIDDHLYAVVNVNTFVDIDPSSLPRSAASFEGESRSERLDRRQKGWIKTVHISGT